MRVQVSPGSPITRSIIKRTAWNKGLSKETDERVRKHAALVSKRLTGIKRKPLSPEHKLNVSKGRIRFLKEHPDQVPYKLNHYSKGDSYPERYFKELVKIEDISLKFHKSISIYELDFYNEEKKVVVEIDGEQHYCDKRIVASDIKRTNFLSGLGWRVYRVRWSEYQKKSYEDKNKVVQEIKDLLK